MKAKGYIICCMTLFFIVLLGIALRIYKMGELAVFLADQASDSTAVLQMLRGKFTLLGPVTSVGGFYNGPIVYYLMLPFYWLFRGDPLSGTIFQSFFSIATIPVVYLIGKKINSRRVGLSAAFFFAVSPLMVDYSRAALIPYPAVFFSTLILYLLLWLREKFSIVVTLILGGLIGCIIQMHYLTISFVLLAGLYPFFVNKKSLNLKYFISLGTGIIAGLSPFLLFEVRHQFLNTTLFLRYLSSGRAAEKSIVYALTIWPDVTAQILFGNIYLLGIVGFLLIFVSCIFLFFKKRKEYSWLSLFFLLFVIIEIISLVYGRKLQTHYVISFHVPLILMCAVTLNYLLKNKYILIVALVALLLLNAAVWNLNLDRHPVQDRLNIADFKRAAGFITQDKKANYNVAMDAEGDNRAMPLRYMLKLKGENPMTYEDYGGADILYFIGEKNKPLSKMTMWEYTSFGGKYVSKKWDVNDQYYLYKLTKNEKK